MPRFQQLTGDFQITTGPDADPVTWRFERTPDIEREFTLADGRGRGRPHTRTMLPVMLSALAGWEGVLDADGRQVEYSEQAFHEYIPSSMRLELLSRWTQQMRGAQGDGADASAEGSTDLPPDEEGVQPTSSTDLPADEEAVQPTSGIDLPADGEAAQRTRSIDLPADEGAVQPTSGIDFPADEEAAQRTSSTDLPADEGAVQPTSGIDLPADEEAAQRTSSTDLPVDEEPAQPTGTTDLPADEEPVQPTSSTDLPPGEEPVQPTSSTDLPPDEEAVGATTDTEASEGIEPVESLPAASRFGDETFLMGEPSPESGSLLDDPDLDMNWRLEDAVETMYGQNRLAEQYEPLY